MKRYLTVTVVAASLFYATDSSGQGSDTRHIYEACLASESGKGAYTASDGGISALRLMDQCKPQLDEWRIDCMAAAKSANQCNLLAASYAQAVLEQKARVSKE